MIVEIVTFELPAGTDREAALAFYQPSAEVWSANPDLVEKYFFFDGARGLGGGVYVWRSREASARWHDAAYRERVLAQYGFAPRIEIFDALIHVNPAQAAITPL